MNDELERTCNDIIASNNKEYKEKMKEVSIKLENAEMIEQEAINQKNNIEQEIDERAESKIENERLRLKNKYEAATDRGYGLASGLAIYGVMATILTAIRSEVFINDFKAFFSTLWLFIKKAFSGLLIGADFMGQGGKIIPQPVIAEIVGWLYELIFWVICVAVMYFLCIGLQKYIFKYIRWDILTIGEVLISLAIIIFFADGMKAIIPFPMNLLLLHSIIFGVYVGIRAVFGSRDDGDYY